jgi:hypothetical protein
VTKRDLGLQHSKIITDVDARQRNASADTIAATTTTMAINKRESTNVDSKKPKGSSSIRRFLHLVKHATLKNRRNDTNSLEAKDNDMPSAPSISQSSTTESETEAAEAKADDSKANIEFNRPIPTAPQKSKPATASEPVRHTLASVPENAATNNDANTFSSAPITSKSINSFPPTAMPSKSHHSRQSRKPTMITPELLQQIEISNRRRSGGTLRDVDQLRTKNLGTTTMTTRAKTVVASPLRWSEE